MLAPFHTIPRFAMYVASIPFHSIPFHALLLIYARLNQLVNELRSASPVRATGRVSQGHSEELLPVRRQRGTKGKLSQVSCNY